MTRIVEREWGADENILVEEERIVRKKETIA
jgi:hypothetical protein